MDPSARPFIFLSPLLLGLVSFLLLSVPTSASPVPTPTIAPFNPFFSRSSLNTKSRSRDSLVPRTDDKDEGQASYPYFPNNITSCGVCSQSYASLNSCMAAAPVFDDVSAILLNPLGFIDVIKCACTETFQSLFPQCVDCFEKTNQTYFITTQADRTNASSLVTGMREVCGLASVLLGNVAVINSDLTPLSLSMRLTLPSPARQTYSPVSTSTPASTSTSTVEAVATASASSPSSTSKGTSGTAPPALIALALAGLVALI